MPVGAVVTALVVHTSVPVLGKHVFGFLSSPTCLAGMETVVVFRRGFFFWYPRARDRMANCAGIFTSTKAGQFTQACRPEHCRACMEERARNPPLLCVRVLMCLHALLWCSRLYVREESPPPAHLDLHCGCLLTYDEHQVALFTLSFTKWHKGLRTGLKIDEGGKRTACVYVCIGWRASVAVVLYIDAFQLHTASICIICGIT